ncbi:MAG: phytoene synthase, partial [Frankiales bacterium]|nr:phytoene synthase [Frankiales bacterium]
MTSDVTLEAAYATCRRLNARYGRSYYLATRLLPAWKRPSVHALYGFARWCDEIVDDLASSLSPEQRADALDTFGRSALDGSSQHHAAVALRDTMGRWGIPAAHVEAFLRSMRMDLTVSSYKTF